MTAIYQPNRNGNLTRHVGAADGATTLCGLDVAADWPGSIPFGKREPAIWTCDPCKRHPDAMATSMDAPPPAEPIAAPIHTTRKRRPARLGLFDQQPALL